MQDDDGMAPGCQLAAPVAAALRARGVAASVPCWRGPGRVQGDGRAAWRQHCRAGGWAMGWPMAGGAQTSGAGKMTMMAISAINWHGLRGCTDERPIGNWRQSNDGERQCAGG